MDPTFERYLNEIRQFLEEAQSGALSNEDEEYLKILADVERNLENLKETGEFDQTATLKNVCQAVLQGNYICLKNKVAVMSKKLNEVEQAEIKGMPEKLQPKIKEIKGYFAKLRELIKNMDNLVKKIRNKINGFAERDYKLTEKEKIEVKLLNIDFKTVVKKTDDYFNQADRVMKMFESDVVSYKKDKKIDCVIYGGLAILATAGAAGAAAGAVGAFGGGSFIFGLDYSIYSSQCQKVEIKLEELNSELRDLNMGQEENKSTLEGEVDKANLLVNM